LRALHFDTALTPDGWLRDAVVTIDDRGLIADVSARARPGTERIAGAALPGLPNLHSHAFQRGMAGLSEHAGDSEDSFWTWREAMYRFLDTIDPDDAEAIAAMAYVEMLEGGFTVVGEFHYLHHDPAGRPYANPAEMAVRHVAAAAHTGIGMTLLPVFYAHGNFAGVPPTQGQRRFLSDLDDFARLHEASGRALRDLPHGVLGVAPHSLRAVSLQELASLLRAHPAGPVHIHVSEQVKEVADCMAAHACRPVELLLAEAPVDSRWCLIHATHADARERAAIAASGAVVGLCPVTESNLGDGIFGAVDFRAAGGRLGVGTDSNILLSAPLELRTLEYSQRLSTLRRNALAPRNGSTARTLYDAARVGGAQALGLGPAGLVAGARADVVVLDTSDVTLAQRSGDLLLDALVFSGGERAIREVWSAGVRVVEDGRHIARAAVERRFRATLARILG
jgi:formimidoylglutamate deiminase